MKKVRYIIIMFSIALSAFGQSKDDVDTLKMQHLNEVTVTAH